MEKNIRETLSVGQKVNLTIEKIIFGGEGLGHYEGITVFVPMSIPGEELEIEIISIKKSYARGLITKIIVPSKDRVEDLSKVSFEDFDGCDFGMLKYEKQLEFKDQITLETIEKISGLEIRNKYENIIGSEFNKNYRNKTSEPIFKESGIIKTGFYSKKSHNVFEATESILKSKIAEEVTRELLTKINALGTGNNAFKVYNEANNSGFLKHIIIRNNEKNDVMIIVVIHKKSQLKNLLQILEDMYKAKEEIKSVYISLKEEANNIKLGEELRHYFGAKYIEEEIEGLKFKIYPDSFFQVNKKQAEKLYNKAIEFFGEIEDKTIVDAFSGTGTIGMLLAKKAKNVIGIESIESSVMSAKESALENNIENIKFICGKVEKEFSKVMKSEKIDGVIFDPPRKGIDEKVLNVLKENRVPSLVYISCNPSTFARDAKILDDLGYKLEKIASVDMFSQTHHIEVVAKFVDKK